MANIRIDDKKIIDIDLFVFDKDGTLIDLYCYWYNMVELRARRLCETCSLSLAEHKENLMSEMGIDISNKRLKPNGPVGLLPRGVVQKAAKDYLAKQGCRDASSICFDVFEEVDRLSLGLLDEFIKPLDGAITLLRNIKSRKAKVAIATTDKTDRAKIVVDFLRIGNLVNVVVGADKVKSSKPAPDMLEFIGMTLGIEPFRSAVVGDAKTDIQMGINAKFKASIGVCSGLTAKDELERLTPYVVTDISEIEIE